MAEPIISLQDLTRRFGPRTALDRVTLEIPPGVTGLLGPNGAGKSTLVRILLGMDHPDGGTVRVLGRDPVTDGREVRRRVGYSAEGPSLVPGLQGVEQVALAAELAGWARRDALLRAHESLAFVGLEEARYRKVEQYSTGMRQRLKLAQAVVAGPQLLVLDEPTNGLDPEGRRDVIAMIRTLAERDGVSILLSSHVLRDVEAACRWAIVLRAGAVVSEGPVEEHHVEEADAGGRTWIVRVIGDAEAFRSAARAGGAEAAESLGDGARTRVEASGARQVFAWARSAGVSVLECRPARTSLEEVYLRAFGQDEAADGARWAVIGTGARQDPGAAAAAAAGGSR